MLSDGPQPADARETVEKVGVLKELFEQGLVTFNMLYHSGFRIFPLAIADIDLTPLELAFLKDIKILCKQDEEPGFNPHNYMTVANTPDFTRTQIIDTLVLDFAGQFTDELFGKLVDGGVISLATLKSLNFRFSMKNLEDQQITSTTLETLRNFGLIMNEDDEISFGSFAALVDAITEKTNGKL